MSVHQQCQCRHVNTRCLCSAGVVPPPNHKARSISPQVKGTMRSRCSLSATAVAATADVHDSTEMPGQSCAYAWACSACCAAGNVPVSEQQHRISYGCSSLPNMMQPVADNASYSATPACRHAGWCVTAASTLAVVISLRRSSNKPTNASTWHTAAAAIQCCTG